jgi:hypothetical protein
VVVRESKGIGDEEKSVTIVVGQLVAGRSWISPGKIVSVRSPRSSFSPGSNCRKRPLRSC